MITLVNWTWATRATEGLLTNAMFAQANVIVEVEEAKRPFSGDLGVFSKPEVSNWYHFSLFKCWFGLYIVSALMLLVVYSVWLTKADEAFQC